jgi:parallel beta-helix repeat protein
MSCEDENLKQFKIISLLCLTAFSLVFVSFRHQMSDASLYENNQEEVLSISSIQQYIGHSAINITSYDDFNTTANVTGNGTQYDPFILDNFNITDSSQTLISIENTREYFIISNCLLNGKTKNYNGISLTNVTNGFIDYNTIKNCSFGMKLTSTENTTLSNNDVFYNKKDGINLTSSHNNNVSFNTVHHNGGNPSGNGIVLDPSNHNLIHNNSLYNNSINGLLIYNSINTTISNNDVYHNEKDGIHLENTHNSTISDNFVHNNGGNPSGNGIVLDPSNHNLIHNNSVYNNTVNGIQINDSTNVSVINNSIYFNKKDGIFFENTHYSNISDNFVHNNGGNPSGNGIVLDPSNHNQILNNSVYNNSVNGIQINDSINVSIKDNSIDFNKKNGIFFENTNRSVISFNLIYKNGGNPSGNGIVLDPSSYNNITNNIIMLNSVYGIDITDGTLNNNIISNDFICNNLNNPKDAQAKDDGEHNNFTNNYWSDHNETSPYLIDGLKETSDNSPSDTPNEYSGEIPCTYPRRTPGLSFAVLMSSVIILIMFQRRRKK